MTKFTVFYSSGFLTDGNCGCHALVDFLREEVVGSMPPIAWAPVAYWEWAKENRGRDCDYLRAESIAAGRLIEFRDGKYIPLGVAEEAPKPAEEQEFCDRLALDAAADLANAAMIARDGPAKQLMPCTCGIPVTGVIHRLDGPCYQAEPKSTAKPALDGLTRIGAMSHMLGSAFLKG